MEVTAKMDNTKTVDYHIRPYQSGEEEQLVEFLNIGFNGWPNFDLDYSPVEHWKWKFLENPLGLNSIAVAEIDDKIIGFNGEIYQYVKVGDKLLFSRRSADLAVHPDYRRMGVSTQMSSLKKELRQRKGVQMGYSASGNRIILQYRKKHGNLFFPHVLCEKVCIKDVDKFLERHNIKYKFIIKIGFLALKNINAIVNAIKFNRNNSYNDNDIIIRRIHEFDENIDRFWGSIKDGYYFIIERTQKYLNWRYCDKRGGDYYVVIAEQDGDILGYIVLRINRILDDYPEGTIVDLLTLPDRLDVARKLIVHAVDYFNENKVISVNVWTVKNHPYDVLYERYGFIEITRTARTVFNTTPVDVGEEWELFESAQPSQLHIQLGDLDWI